MDWTTLPRAHGGPLADGVIRAEPADFRVDEIASIEPTGSGEHLWLRIEKSDINTHDVAVDLARAFAVDLVDVSYAGMKDRRAIARQWFSVRTPRDAEREGSAAWRIVETRRHVRKLRRGELAGNAFRIRVREVRGDIADLPELTARLAELGVPNYFGEQRFGRDGGNVERARAWVCRRPRPAVSPLQKGLHLSTARALLFNAVLARRVAESTWRIPIDGDVELDGAPTGPLWGRGRPPTTGRAREAEAAALDPHREWLDPLEHLGLTQERRALVARPRDVRIVIDGADVELAFSLSPGQYATAVLRELGEFRAVRTESAAEAAA
ncbi:MAG TPA: tRNA pseudouridine(13) synthase TruD [Pseudomonadales bacterium]|nr:tRNA pseudouridine(13) synthase TruD [Pseudomonadales bacterium]